MKELISCWVIGLSGVVQLITPYLELNVVETEYSAGAADKYIVMCQLNNLTDKCLCVVKHFNKNYHSEHFVQDSYIVCVSIDSVV